MDWWGMLSRGVCAELGDFFHGFWEILLQSHASCPCWSM